MGCFVVLVVLSLIDSVSAWLLVGALGALGSVFFASAAHDQIRGAQEPQPAIVHTPFFPRPWILASGFAVLALANGAIQPYGLKLSMVKERIEKVTDPDSLILWNSFSRVNVGEVVEWTPDMWGPSPTMPVTEIQQRYMQVDGSAASPYRFEAIYRIRHDGRAAVIGVGGGRDLLSAAYFGFRDITGVELTAGPDACRPGDQFRSRDVSEAIEFQSHRPLSWRQPA